jgi:hypothetical protein
MGRQAFYREGPTHANAARIRVRSVVEILDLGTSGDGSVDLALALETVTPPVSEPAFRSIISGIHTVPSFIGRNASMMLFVKLARNFPFLPVGAKCFVK